MNCSIISQGNKYSWFCTITDLSVTIDKNDLIENQITETSRFFAAPVAGYRAEPDGVANHCEFDTFVSLRVLIARIDGLSGVNGSDVTVETVEIAVTDTQRQLIEPVLGHQLARVGGSARGERVHPLVIDAAQHIL